MRQVNQLLGIIHTLKTKKLDCRWNCHQFHRSPSSATQ
uniref:Uncharacterized protein n=1 Tax=Arundo donax TaxID=35708 RepID=A0A0A8ZPS4_ARUDO